MKNQHLVIMLMAFLTVLISLYFGISIYNIEDNIHVNHLLEDEGFTIHLPEEIPTLGFKAAVLTGLLLMVGFVTQVYVFLKTPIKLIKKISIAPFICFSVIFGFSTLFLFNPMGYNFKDYGMIWVTLSLIIIFSNGISLFVKR